MTTSFQGSPAYGLLKVAITGLAKGYGLPTSSQNDHARVRLQADRKVPLTTLRILLDVQPWSPAGRPTGTARVSKGIAPQILLG